ncbi:MAG: alpha/beta fold hydrolase [Gammaproteobacteria bacterium]
MAAQAGTPIRRLIVNDIGPEVPKEALERIATYAGREPQFPELAALEAYVRVVYAPFGPLTDAAWRHLARHSARALPGGGYAMHYDPGIGEAFRRRATEWVDQWEVWDRVRCPVLILRGERSDLLTRACAAEMQRRGPKAELIEFAGIGHAPMITTEAEINAVRERLLRP